MSTDTTRRESKRALLIVMAIAAVFIGIATSGNQTSSTPPSSSYRSTWPTADSTAFVYSSEPPQDWLDGCIDFQRLINQKYANARAKYNLRDGYLPPESSCRETWKDPAGQRQWHGYSLEQKQKSIWLDPVARQQKVRNMPELN